MVTRSRSRSRDEKSDHIVPQLVVRAKPVLSMQLLSCFVSQTADTADASNASVVLLTSQVCCHLQGVENSAAVRCNSGHQML
jgi:hypothetical protein